MKKAAIVLFLLLGFVFRVNAVDTSAKSAILYDANTGEILYEKNPHERRPIASTTKIMTALLVIENGCLDDEVDIKKEHVGTEGTSLYLKEGESVSVKTLLYGLMLKSGNDAAEVLADYIAGDVGAFVKMMNEKAKNLKMENTNFANPHGLPKDNHYSTAYDMALLSAYAMNNDTFKEIASTPKYAAQGRSFKNHNKLLFMREEINGIKTGFTKAAGRCLVSSAEKNNMHLIAVTLSAPNDWDDHLKLYDFGFDNFKTISISKEGDSIAQIPVVGYGKIEVVTQSGFSTTLKCDESIEKQVYLPRFCYAPIKKGQKIGELHIKNGNAIKKIDLVSGKEINLPEKKNIFKKFLDKIKNG